MENQFLLVTFADTTSDSRLCDATLRLLGSYHQEAAVVTLRGRDDALLLRTEGTRASLGTWTRDRLAEFYTTKRYGTDAGNRSFTILCADDLSLSTRMAMHYLRG